VVFELTDGEIRAFWFSVPPFRKPVHSSALVKFDRIPISTGLIEQGNVRNENALVNILLTYASHHPCERIKAYLAIPLQQGFIRAYTLPWLPKRDRKAAISLLVDEEISIERSDLLFDFVVISEEKHKSLQILLGAARQSLLDRYVLIFGQAGFKVTGVEFAFSVLGQVLGFEPSEDVLYLQGESDYLQMALFRGSVPENVRTLLPLQQPLSLPLSVESEVRTNERTEEWENEIRRYLLYYRTQQSNLNLKRLVWSGDKVIDQLAQGLLASNHVSVVEQVRISSVPDSWREVLEENKGRCEVVVGYALRISSHHPGLNLWCQPNMAHKTKRKYYGLALFSAALLLIGTIIWFSLFQITLSLQQEVQELYQQGARIEAQAKQKEALETAWNKVKVHPERIGEGLAQVNILTGTGVTIEKVIYKQGTMSLSGSANDEKDVQMLIHTLRTMGWVQPALSSYKLDSQNNLKFILSAKR
jgi:Tfp pilus assembly PilM family ATPase